MPRKAAASITTAPKLDDRVEQPYLAIRTQVPWTEFKKVIPAFTMEVVAYLRTKGIAGAGRPPFIRYLVINMEAKMDVEIGVPVATPQTGDGRIAPGAIPAGRYASLVYTGVRNGYKANGALLDWGKQQGLSWDQRETENGDAFGCRYESFITDPADEPDMKKWEAEVAIRLADG